MVIVRVQPSSVASETLAPSMALMWIAPNARPGPPGPPSPRAKPRRPGPKPKRRPGPPLGASPVAFGEVSVFGEALGDAAGAALPPGSPDPDGVAARVNPAAPMR